MWMLCGTSLRQSLARRDILILFRMARHGAMRRLEAKANANTGLKVMHDKRDVAPDSTAARVALWRALHVEADPPPHVLEDRIGLALLSPDEDWRSRAERDPRFTSYLGARSDATLLRQQDS
jgi:hypothetical protein